jgi:RHS repeat-associated protein
VHPDHLGSTNVVTDENGNVVQTLDYYPYGSTRISVGTSTNEKRKFIGQFADDSTLSYLNARYYEGSRGQFVSEDPAFLAVGNSNQLQQLSQPDQQKFLADPQQMNAYSYGRDNPITDKDPQGLWALRVVHHALDIVEKELSARIEVNATVESRPRPLTELPYPDIQLGALAKPLCRCNVSPSPF